MKSLVESEVEAPEPQLLVLKETHALTQDARAVRETSFRYELGHEGFEPFTEIDEVCHLDLSIASRQAL